MPFAVNFISFILVNLIVLGCASLVAIILNEYKITDWKKYFLSVGLLFFAQIFVSEFILGTCKILTFQNAFILNILYLLILLMFFGKRILKTSCCKLSLNDSFAAIAIFSPFVAIFLLRYFNALFQIPLEYDNVAYHLPFIVEWYKTADLTQIYYSAFAGPLGYYPSNFELFGLWTYLPFGRDYFVNLVNLPIFPLLFLGIYSVCRNLKVDKISSLIVVALFLYMPQTFRQMGVSLVDLFFSLTFISSIYFLQEFWKSKSINDIILFGIAGGLFVGTKYLGLPYLLPLAIAAVILILIKQRVHLKQAFLSLSILPITFLLCGGFWYIRNWLNVGNPLFPLELNIFGFKLFEGYHGLSEKVLSTSLSNNVVDWPTLTKFSNKFFLMVGAPSFLITFALIALVLFLVGSVIRLLLQKNKTTKRLLFSDLLLGMALVLGSIYYFYFYWKAPYTFQDLIPNVRYAMMFLLIGSLAVGFIASRIKFIQPLIYFFAFIAFVYNICFLIIFPPSEIISNDRILLDPSIISKYPVDFSIYLILFLSLVVILLYFLSFNNGIKKKLFIFVIAILIAVPTSFKLLNKTLPEREKLRDYYSKLWYGSDPNNNNFIITQIAKWFDENHSDAKIAYSGFNFHYHLFGRDLQRAVDYVNINSCLKCRYGDYKSNPESIRANPDFSAWMKNLKDLGKNYLIIAPKITDKVRSYELEWAKANPKNFALEYEKNNIFVYKITY